MITTKRDLQVLLCLARYYLLNRPQLQRLCFPDDKEGRITRGRLAVLAAEGLIRKHYTREASQFNDPPSTIYLLTSLGCRLLAAEKGDRRFLSKPVKLPHALQLPYQLAITELHLILEDAIFQQSKIKLEAWYSKFDIINSHELDPKKRYGLNTVCGHKKICAPGAAFLLNNQGQQRIYYVETDHVEGRVSIETLNLSFLKTKAYALLARQKGHQMHFPGTNSQDFTVLMIVPKADRRDELQREFSKRHSFWHRKDLWRFAAMEEINVKKILYGNIFYCCFDKRCLARVEGKLR